MSSRNSAIIHKALTTVGSREWRSFDGTKYRVYLDNLIQFYPALEIGYRSNGGVKWARLYGNPISNARASQILRGLNQIRIWWDLYESEWGSRAIGWEDMAEEIIEEVEARLQETVRGGL